MRLRRTSIGIIAAGLMAFGASPAAAAGLECMADTYDDDQLAQIAEASVDFSFDGSNDANGELLGEIAADAALVCMVDNEWSEDGGFYAIIYELSRLSEHAYRQSGRLSESDLAKLDLALEEKATDRVWEVLEKAVVAGMEDQEDDGLTLRDDMALGAFILSAGFTDEGDTAERVGELLGLIAMQRYTQREFALVEQPE